MLHVVVVATDTASDRRDIVVVNRGVLLRRRGDRGRKDPTAEYVVAATDMFCRSFYDLSLFKNKIKLLANVI